MIDQALARHWRSHPRSFGRAYKSAHQKPIKRVLDVQMRVLIWLGPKSFGRSGQRDGRVDLLWTVRNECRTLEFETQMCLSDENP